MNSEVLDPPVAVSPAQRSESQATASRGGVEASRGPLNDGSPFPRLALLGMESDSHRPGGLNRYFEALARALAASGADTSRLVVGPAPGGLPGVRAGGRISDPLPIRMARYWWAAQPMAGGADLVDAHFALYALLPLHFGRLARHPWTVHFQGPWADESALERRIGTAGRLMRVALERAVYRRSQELVTLSAAFRRVLVESYGVLPWRVHVIPPGVDLEAFSPEGREQARAALGLARDDQVVLAVRRLTPRMGLSVLLDAWTKVAGAGRNRLLAIAGDGPLMADLERQAKRSGLSGQLRLLGRLDEATLACWFRAADVSVVPSLALEGFGLVVLESLASGTPVLVSDAGGLPEAVQGLDPSLVVPAGDAGALATRLREALDGRLPPRLDCRRHAEHFSWERVSSANLAVYRRALEVQPPRGIRVVYLDHAARLSGGELALLRLVPALEGVDAHVIVAEDGPLVRRLLRAGVSVEVVPMYESARALPRDRVEPGRLPPATAIAAATYVVRLARRLRRLHPDLVHTNSLKAAVYGGMAARLARVPCVWHIRDRIAPDYLPAAAVRALQAAGRRLPAAVIADTQASLAYLSLPAGVGHVIPSPVEVTRPAAAGNRDGGFRLGIVGRVARWKGQHVFLSAFAEAFPEESARAVVIGEALFEGDKSYAAEVRAFAEELGIGSRVDFVGFTEEVSAELAGLDVLVHASVVPEPFGQVVVEGMAAGLPVVATDGGGPREIITDGVDGLLYPAGDEHALAEMLRRLAADPGLRKRLGQAGQSRASQFSTNRVAPQVVDVYREVLGLDVGEVLVGR
jgi:glycosyltransferase involved in cell wall biosynthesis